jgi:hypothetical protein
LFDELRLLDSNLLDFDVVSGPNQELHLHGLDGNERIICLDLLADLAVDLDDSARHGALDKVLLVHHDTRASTHILILLLLKLERCSLRVKAEHLIRLLVEEIWHGELFLVCPNQKLAGFLGVAD